MVRILKHNRTNNSFSKKYSTVSIGLADGATGGFNVPLFVVFHYEYFSSLYTTKVRPFFSRMFFIPLDCEITTMDLFTAYKNDYIGTMLSGVL